MYNTGFEMYTLKKFFFYCAAEVLTVKGVHILKRQAKYVERYSVTDFCAMKALPL